MIISELDLALARTPAPFFGLRRRSAESPSHPPPHPTTSSPVAAAATSAADEPLVGGGGGGDGGVDESSPPLGGDKAAASATAAVTASAGDGGSGGDGNGGGDGGGGGGSNEDGETLLDADAMGVSHTTPKPTTPRRPTLPLVVGPGDLAVREDHPLSRRRYLGERNERPRPRSRSRSQSRSRSRSRSRRSRSRSRSRIRARARGGRRSGTGDRHSGFASRRSHRSYHRSRSRSHSNVVGGRRSERESRHWSGQRHDSRGRSRGGSRGNGSSSRSCSCSHHDWSASSYDSYSTSRSRSTRSRGHSRSTSRSSSCASLTTPSSYIVSHGRRSHSRSVTPPPFSPSSRPYWHSPSRSPSKRGSSARDHLPSRPSARGREHRYRRNRAAEFGEPESKRGRATDGRYGVDGGRTHGRHAYARDDGRRRRRREGDGGGGGSSRGKGELLLPNSASTRPHSRSLNQEAGGGSSRYRGHTSHGGRRRNRGSGVSSPPPSRQAANASSELGDVGSTYDGRGHHRRSTRSFRSSERRRRRRSDSAAQPGDAAWAAPSAAVTSVPVSERWAASPPPSRSPSPTASMRSRTLSPSGARLAGTAQRPPRPHHAVVLPPPSPPPRRRSPSREQWPVMRKPVVGVTPARQSQPAVAAPANAATARGDGGRQPVFLPRATSLRGRSLSATSSSQSDVSSASGQPSMLSGGVTVYEDRSREAVAAAAELAAGDPTTAHPLAATSRAAHVRESERATADSRRAASTASHSSSNPGRERDGQRRQRGRRRRHHRSPSLDADGDDGEDDNSIAFVSGAARDGEDAPRRSGPYTAADVLGIADMHEPPSRSPSVTSSLQGRLPSDVEADRKGDSQTCRVQVTIAPTDLGTLTQRDIVAVLETRVLPARHEVTTAARRDKILWAPVEEVALPQADLTGGPLFRTFEEPLTLHPNADLRRQSREVRVLYYELVPTVHSEPERIQLAYSSVRLEHVSEVDAGRLVVPVELFPRPTGMPASVKAALGRRPGGGRRQQPPPTTAFTLTYVRSGEQPVLIDISLTVHRLVGWPFSAARPFFVLYVPRPGSRNSWKPIWRSEVMVASRIVGRSPSFLAGRSPSEFHYSPVELPSLSSISASSSADDGGSDHSDDGGGEDGNPDGSATGRNGGDGEDDQRLLIEFFHYKTSGNPRLLGILRTSLNELRAMPAEGGSLSLNTPQFKQLVGGARLRFISPVPAGVRYALHFEFGGLTAGTCYFLRLSVAFGPLLADLAAPRSGGRRKVSAFFVLFCRRSSSRRGAVVQPDEGMAGGDGGGGGAAADEGSSTSDTERDSWKQLFQSEAAGVDCPKPQRAQGGGSADVRRFSHLVGSLWRERSDASPAASRGSIGDAETPSSSRAAGAAPSSGDGASAPHVIPFRYYRIPPLGHCRSPENCELLLSVFLYHPTGNHKQVASVRTSFAELLAAPTDTPLPRFYAVPAVAAGASASVSRSERQEQRSFVDVRFAFPSA